MPSWPFWVLFLLVGGIAVVMAKRLDDAERRRWRERTSSMPHDWEDSLSETRRSET